MRLSELNSVYFLGVGGIGMSAIARYFNSIGIEVSGYDLRETELTKTLVAEGISINYEDVVANIPESIDLVVYTPAIPAENKQFQYLKDSDVEMKKRAEVLGLISKDTFTIGVAGTHGKTSISTLIAHLLQSSGVGCTAFLGGISANYKTNYIEGNKEVVVVEADEYDRSFLHLSPSIAVVSSVDADHLDVYGDLSTMVSTFQDYLDCLKGGGKVLLHHDVSKKISSSAETYVYSAFESADIALEEVFVNQDEMPPKVRIDCKLLGIDFQGLPLHAPGMYNVENTMVACAVAKLLGASDQAIKQGMGTFKGTKRRFEYHLDGTSTKEVYIDDYAHHPTEIKSALSAVKQIYPSKKLTVAFQPHLFSRTNDFYEAFGESLSIADEVVLLDIYPAREKPMEGVTSQLIFDKIKGVEKQMCSKEELVATLQEKDLEVLVTLGAGDIDKTIEPIKEMLLS